MSPNKWPQCIHRGVRKIPGRKGQGTSQRPSPIHLQNTTTGHPMDPEQLNIVYKQVNSHSRTIKETMFIHIQDPTLNRNLGKYQLLHIWHNLLQASLCYSTSHPAFQPLQPHPLKSPTGPPLNPLPLPI